MRSSGSATNSSTGRWPTKWRIGAVVVVCVFLQGCDSIEVTGPTWVHNDQIATYVFDMEPYYNHINATVYVIAEVPESWYPVGWRYSGEIDGNPIQNSGVITDGVPGVCTMPELPAGYKRVFAEDGVFPTLEPGRDFVTAELDFNTGELAGSYQLTFYTHGVDDQGVECDTFNPATIDVHQWRQLEWEQLIGTSSPSSPGLGGVVGRFGGRAEFGGFFYTIFRPVDSTNEVWRTADFINWELVREVVEAEDASTLYVFGGRLFMIAYHNPPGAPPAQWELWATDDGIDWELMTVWFDYPQVVIESPQVLSVVLSRGEPYEFEYFLTTSSDGSIWSVGGAPFAAYPELIGSGVFFDGMVFFGGSDEDELTAERRPKVWRSDGATVDVIDTAAMALDDNRSVTSMEVHRDLLHLGTRADLGGEVWRFDGSSTWQQIGDHGLGLPGDGYIRDLASHLGSLFAGLRRDDDGASEIWIADHNEIWSKSDLDDVTSGSFVYLMSATGGELYAASEFELWRRVLLFGDGFETTDPSRWSSWVPEN